MSEESLLRAYCCLELKPSADKQAVEDAYHSMKALYEEEALATYGLFDESERLRLLEEVEAAYRLLKTSEEPSHLLQETVAFPSSEPLPRMDEVTSPGAYLRWAREARGITQREIATRTNIGTRHLSMIEDECYESLPAPVYLRGFVFSYARAVDVPDPEEVTRCYLDRFRKALGEQA